MRGLGTIISDVLIYNCHTLSFLPFNFKWIASRLGLNDPLCWHNRSVTPNCYKGKIFYPYLKGKIEGLRIYLTPTANKVFLYSVLIMKGKVTLHWNILMRSRRTGIY